MSIAIMPPSNLSPLQVLRLYRPHASTFGDLVASRCAFDPARTAIVFEGRSWTWAELERSSLLVAGALAARGIVAGDRVVAMGRNSAWHVFVLIALARLGAIMVPVNPDFKVEETAYVFRHSGAVGILCDEAARAVAGKARDEAAPQVWIAGLDETLVATEQPAVLPASDPEAVCVIVYTSGTTGFPKGAMHSQSSMIAAGEAFVERMHLQPDDRVLLILPMFHINALFYSVAGSLAAGATLLVQPRFSASTFWRTVAELGATEVNFIEAIGSILLSRPADEFVPTHTLTKVYGVREAMVEGFRNRFGVRHLIGGYAMTEIPGVLSTPFDGPTKPGSMGVLGRHPDPQRKWARCRIVDDAGRDLPDGEVGELLVETPVAMKGYFGDPAQTAASFRDGWFMTGDLVYRDAEGFFTFVSRKKDIIRRRGENIAGLELDRVIAELPGIFATAAVGVPSPLGEEDILVAAVCNPGAMVSEADVVAWCRSRLAPAKVPRYVIFLDALPYTPTHKVAKSVLRADPTLRKRAVDFNGAR